MVFDLDLGRGSRAASRETRGESAPTLGAPTLGASRDRRRPAMRTTRESK
jgi:hypothetical protein